MVIMDVFDGKPLPRINGAMLSQYQGRPVCILGYASDVDASGKAFKLRTSDNITISVQLKTPIQEYVNGVVEVHGIVQPRNTVICHNCIVFSEEMAQGFDISLYNEAITLMNQLPEHYTLSAP